MGERGSKSSGVEIRQSLGYDGWQNHQALDGGVQTGVIKRGDIKDAELFGLSNWVDGDVIYKIWEI